MANLFDPFLSPRPSITTRIICSRNTHNKHATLAVASSLHFASGQPPTQKEEIFSFFFDRTETKETTKEHAWNNSNIVISAPHVL
jgi:hypothetical protein